MRVDIVVTSAQQQPRSVPGADAYNAQALRGSDGGSNVPRTGSQFVTLLSVVFSHGRGNNMAIFYRSPCKAISRAMHTSQSDHPSLESWLSVTPHPIPFFSQLVFMLAAQVQLRLRSLVPDWDRTTQNPGALAWVCMERTAEAQYGWLQPRCSARWLPRMWWVMLTAGRKPASVTTALSHAAHTLLPESANVPCLQRPS